MTNKMTDEDLEIQGAHYGNPSMLLAECRRARESEARLQEELESWHKGGRVQAAIARAEKAEAGLEESRREENALRGAFGGVKRERDGALEQVKDLKEELARIQRLPEMDWARVSTSIMQTLAGLSRAGVIVDAIRMRDILDQGKTYINRILDQRDEALDRLEAVLNVPGNSPGPRGYETVASKAHKFLKKLGRK